MPVGEASDKIMMVGPTWSALIAVRRPLNDPRCLDVRGLDVRLKSSEETSVDE